MPGTFSIHPESTSAGDDQVCVLHIAGHIDEAATTEFEDVFTGVMAGGCRHFVLDLAQADSITSAGLRLLLKLHRAALNAGGRIRIAAPRRRIREQIDGVFFSRLMEVYGTVDEAVGSVAGGQADGDRGELLQS